MSTMTPVRDDDPRMKAWKVYSASDEYANTKKWALHAEHVEGSLWAAFIEGFAAAADLRGRVAPLTVYAAFNANKHTHSLPDGCWKIVNGVATSTDTTDDADAVLASLAD